MFALQINTSSTISANNALKTLFGMKINQNVSQDAPKTTPGMELIAFALILLKLTSTEPVFPDLNAPQTVISTKILIAVSAIQDLLFQTQPASQILTAGPMATSSTESASATTGII